MVKTFFLIFVINIVFCACNSNDHNSKNINSKTKPDTSEKLIFYEINNEDLVRQIEMYMDSINVPSIKNKIVEVYVISIEDTTIYEISYETSAFGLVTAPSTIFSKVNGNIVAISYHNAKEIMIV